MTLTPTDLAPTEDGYGTPAFQKAVYAELGVQMPDMIRQTVKALVEEYPDIDQRQAFRVAAVATAGGTSISALLERVNGWLVTLGDGAVFPPEEIESALTTEIATLTREKVQEGLPIPEIQAILAARWPKATKEQVATGVAQAMQQAVEEAAGFFEAADAMDDLYHAARAKADQLRAPAGDTEDARTIPDVKSSTSGGAA